MINKLKVLGEYIQQNEGDSNPLGLNVTLETANVIVLDFNITNDKSCFERIDTIEFDSSKRKEILYKNVPGNNVSPFPTIFFDKTKIGGSLEKLLRILKKCKEDSPALKSLFVVYQNALNNFVKHKEEIDDDNDLFSFAEKPSKNEFKNIGNYVSNDRVEGTNNFITNLCTIRINNEFIGETSYFQNIINKFQQSSDSEYYKKYGKTSIGNDIKCYTCGKIAEKLYGFCDTFKFYSANEEAYIAGGFQKTKTWKNYPVCPVCASHLRLAREKLNENLNRYFYGNKYLLIPTPTLDKGDFYQDLQDIEEEFHDLSLNKEQENNRLRQMEMEDDVFETLSRQKDQATFTFLFYKASNSEFKILQEAEDILPSRFKKIIEAKRKVEDCDEFKNLKRGNDYYDLSFNFGIIKTFFPSNFNNDFLDITTKILKGQKISKSFITHQISEHLAQGFRNNKLFYDVQKSMIFLKFLYELNLINQTKGKMEVSMENKYEDYFQKHPEFYDADWKKTVFLTGVLAQNVMDIQYRERKATPFRSRLNGLKLDHRAIKRLLPESIEKLEQYKSNYYRDLEENIALLMESGEPELKLQSVDEISFYFAMGMNLNKQFKTQSEKGENNE